MNKFRLVEQVSPEVMDGETELEKILNAYLTSQFILKKNVPSDECLSEARHIISLMRNYDKRQQEI